MEQHDPETHLIPTAFSQKEQIHLLFDIHHGNRRAVDLTQNTIAQEKRELDCAHMRLGKPEVLNKESRRQKDADQEQGSPLFILSKKKE